MFTGNTRNPRDEEEDYTAGDQYVFNTSIFDNDSTIFQKEAFKRGVPSISLISVRNQSEEVIEYRTIVDIVTEMSGSDKSVFDIYEYVRKNSNMDIKIFVYYYIHRKYEKYRPLNEYATKKRRNEEKIIIMSRAKDIESFFEKSDEYKKYRGNLDTIQNVEIELMNTEKLINMVYMDDQRTIKSIFDIQGKMEKYYSKSFFLKSVVEVISVLTIFNPTKLDGAEFDTSDGYKIFESFTASIYTPKIRYVNHNGVSLTKVLGMDSRVNPDIDSIDYRHFENGMPKIIRENTIYITIWMGDAENQNPDEFFTSKADLFTVAIYDLKTNSLKIPIKNKIEGKITNGRENVPDRLRMAFVDMIIPDGNERSLKCAYNLIPVYQRKSLSIIDRENVKIDFKPKAPFEIVNYLIHTLCLLDDTFFRNIYIEESITPSALKRRLDFHYRPMFSDALESFRKVKTRFISNSATVSFALRNKVAVDSTNFRMMYDEKYQIPDNSTLTLNQGYRYLKVSVSNASTIREVERFMEVLETLMMIYHEEYSRKELIWSTASGNQSSPYNSGIGIVDTLYQKSQSATIRLREISRKISEYKDENQRRGMMKPRKERAQNLLSRSPSVFGGSYLASCRADRQPLIYPTYDEAVKWIDRARDEKDDEDFTRSILEFPAPPEDPMFYFVCPNDDHQFPGVIKNNTGHNVEKFPFLPCCFSRDQSKSDYTNYSRYYLKSIVPEKMVDKFVRSGDLLRNGDKSEVPTLVENTIGLFFESDIILYKFGVAISPNSLIHCVLMAIDHEEYTEEDEEGREEMTRDLRKKFARFYDMNLVKQELYDYDDSLIRQKLLDVDAYFDSKIFFRFLEEEYHINIVVIYTPEKYKIDNVDFEIPRHNEFHVRRINRNWKTVILFKHWGNVSDNAKYPNYEIIGATDTKIDERRNKKKDVEAIFLFNEEVSNMVADMVKLSNRKLSIFPDLDGKSITTHLDVYEESGLYEIAKVSGVKQLIDFNGKRQAVTIRHKKYGEFTIFHPPDVPLNLPIGMEEKSIRYKDLKKIFDYKPSSFSLDEEGNVVGAWYSIYEIPNLLYVRISGKVIRVTIPPGPPDPLAKAKTDNFKISHIVRLKKMKEQVNIIKQLVLLAYQVYVKTTENPDINNFIRKRFRVDTNYDPSRDSSSYYNFSKMAYTLREFQNLADVMKFIRSSSKNFAVVEKKAIVFNFYTQKFHDGIVFYLKNQSKVVAARKLPPAMTIEREFLSVDAFSKKPSTEIFVSDSDYIDWVIERMRKYNPFDISQKITLNVSLSMKPYMYQSMDGNVFIIQNTKSGTLDSALNVSNVWIENRINIGPNKDVTLMERPGYLVFGISIENKLIPISDKRHKAKVFSIVVYYGPSVESMEDENVGYRFGAVLPITF